MDERHNYSLCQSIRSQSFRSLHYSFIRSRSSSSGPSHDSCLLDSFLFLCLPFKLLSLSLLLNSLSITLSFLFKTESLEQWLHLVRLCWLLQLYHFVLGISLDSYVTHSINLYQLVSLSELISLYTMTCLLLDVWQQTTQLSSWMVEQRENLSRYLFSYGGTLSCPKLFK